MPERERSLTSKEYAEIAHTVQQGLDIHGVPEKLVAQIGDKGTILCEIIQVAAEMMQCYTPERTEAIGVFSPYPNTPGRIQFRKLRESGQTVFDSAITFLQDSKGNAVVRVDPVTPRENRISIAALTLDKGQMTEDYFIITFVSNDKGEITHAIPSVIFTGDSLISGASPL